jgi:hypothetical protein
MRFLAAFHLFEFSLQEVKTIVFLDYYQMIRVEK